MVTASASGYYRHRHISQIPIYIVAMHLAVTSLHSRSSSLHRPETIVSSRPHGRGGHTASDIRLRLPRYLPGRWGSNVPTPGSAMCSTPPTPWTAPAPGSCRRERNVSDGPEPSPLRCSRWLKPRWSKGSKNPQK